MSAKGIDVSKIKEREELEAAVKAFVKKGGTIEKLPMEASARDIENSDSVSSPPMRTANDNFNKVFASQPKKKRGRPRKSA